MVKAKLKDSSSAPVKRPQHPKEILLKNVVKNAYLKEKNISFYLFPDVQGRLMY